jgi:hypothetical protein
MSFKQELLKKIQIDQLTEKVLFTVGPPESEKKVDRGLFKLLLEMAGYRYLKERDLDIYLPEEGSGRSHILVLDNDLPFYNTTVADIALRKSPTVKEMINIRNAIKILNDKDVVVSKKADSVKTVHNECIARLYLSFSAADIDGIAADGAASLKNGYAEGVQEALNLFAELLGLKPAPKAFMSDHHQIMGGITLKDSGETVFGPIVCYSLMHNRLFALTYPVAVFDLAAMERYQEMVAGTENPPLAGPDVFQFLKDTVMRQGYHPF